MPVLLLSRNLLLASYSLTGEYLWDFGGGKLGVIDLLPSSAARCQLRDGAFVIAPEAFGIGAEICSC